MTATLACPLSKKSSCPLRAMGAFIANGEKWMIVVFPIITLTVFMTGLVLAWLINAIVIPSIG
jgi:hypothetical protein